MAHPSPRPAPPRPRLDSASGLRVKQQPAFLGRYRVIDEIGSGGMATVHLARMEGLGGFEKWVAIKRIHPHLIENDRMVDMFLDEARTAASISHPNVATVFDVGADGDTYWIAMEYLHGETLREVQDRARACGMRIRPEIAARIVIDAAEGLHAAHELRRRGGHPLGLVHRDVSPHNLFLTYDGRTKVVDFGIAKVADRLAPKTCHGTIKGKLAYMSPEQARGGDVDRRTDVFALGVVLWELTTNRRLFRKDSDLETLEAVLAAIVPPPSVIVRGYPLDLEACVMKALALRPEDRYPTAREFARDVQEWLIRSGQFVGAHEIAEILEGLFAERIQMRAAYLSSAAEALSESSQAPEPARETRPMAHVASETTSLLDDDDELPTMIASRAGLERQHTSARPQPEDAVSKPDLGATLALPLDFGKAPSPAFSRPVPPAPAPVFAPRAAFDRALRTEPPCPPLAPTLAPITPAAAPRKHAGNQTRHALVAGLVLLALLGVVVIGLLLLLRAR